MSDPERPAWQVTPSRRDQLAAGDLVDVTPIAAAVKFRLPVAVSRRIWELCVPEPRPAIEHIDTASHWRLYNLLTDAMRALRDVDHHELRCDIQSQITPRPPGLEDGWILASVFIEAGDEPEPVITIRLTDEQ